MNGLPLINTLNEETTALRSLLQDANKGMGLSTWISGIQQRCFNIARTLPTEMLERILAERQEEER